VSSTQFRQNAPPRFLNLGGFFFWGASVYGASREVWGFVHADTASLRSHQFSNYLESAPPAWGSVRPPFTVSPFLLRNRGDRRAPGHADLHKPTKKKISPRDQTLRLIKFYPGWVFFEQNTACVWDGLLRGQIAKKSDLLLRSRCSHSPCRCRRSLSFTCFSTCFSMRLTRFSTRFYTLATMCLRWGWRWGCGFGNRSLRRARGWCRIRCENAGLCDKADGRSQKQNVFYHNYIRFVVQVGVLFFPLKLGRPRRSQSLSTNHSMPGQSSAGFSRISISLSRGL
jgi:hypothetical protein